MSDLQYQYFKGFFEGHEKYILTYQSWRPIFCEKVVVLLHGLGEHVGRYTPLIEAFKNKGIAFYGYDQRGHRLSNGKRGHVPSFQHLAEDFLRFLKLVSVHENNRPLFVFAHSLGGLVCLNYLIDYHQKGGVLPQGVILSNPIIKLALVPPAWKVKLATTVSKILPGLLFHNEVNLNDLSHDPKIAESFDQDPLCHQKISAGFYVEMLKAMERVKNNPGAILAPTLMLLGGQDRVIDPKESQEFFSNMKAQKSLKLYPTFYHELVHEIGKEKVFVDIDEWILGFQEKVSVG